MKKRLLLLVLFAVLAISCWYTFRMLTFTSDREWTALSPADVPALVLDTLNKQRAGRVGTFLIVLDENYKGQTGVEVKDEEFFFYTLRDFIIHYKDKSVKISRKIYNPPYILYQGKLFFAEKEPMNGKGRSQSFKSLSLQD